MASTQPAKICIHCGQDCSGKPRTKDTQGRYACKECHERALAAAKAAPVKVARSQPVAPPPVQEDEGAFVAGLVDDLGGFGGSKMCTGCGAPMASDAAICVSCGLNQQTGERLGTAMLKPPKVKKERSARGGAGFQINPTFVGLGVLALFGVMAAMAWDSELMFGLYALAVVALALPTYISVVVFAFKDGYTGWGIATIAALFVPCVGLAVLYFIFCINERPMIKWLYFAAVLGYIGLIIVGQQHGMGLEDFANR